MSSLAVKRLLVAAVSVIAAFDAVVLAHAANAAGDPPIVSVGSDGQTDACVDESHSGANPGSDDSGSVATVNDRSCTPADSTTSGAATAGRSSGSDGPGAGAQAQAVPTAREQSSARASRAGTVAAANARGIVIARIRYVRSEVRSAGRLRVIVTVRDVDGRSIRDAIVFVRALPGAKPVPGSQATFSNKLGQARFVVTVPRRLLGQRLRFLVGARTPTAHTLALASVRLGAPL